MFPSAAVVVPEAHGLRSGLVQRVGCGVDLLCCLAPGDLPFLRAPSEPVIGFADHPVHAFEIA